MTRAAVLTGDLIASSDAPPEAVEATMALLAAAAEAIGEDSRFTRFRGDGWQIHLPDPGQSLRACLFILATLQAAPGALATRISAGIGSADPGRGPDLSAARGEAFTASGRGLEVMGEARLALDGAGVDRFRKLCFAFAADHAGRWSVEQAQAMALKLAPEGLTQGQIADRLGISRQAVGARLESAKFHLLSAACDAFLDDAGAAGEGDG